MNDPYIIVSADSHAGLPTAEYRQYLDAKFHPQFDDFLNERDQALEASTMLGVRNEDYAKKWFEEHEEALRSGWDAPRRDLELDGDGVAGEIIFPDADATTGAQTDAHTNEDISGPAAANSNQHENAITLSLTE